MEFLSRCLPRMTTGRGIGHRPSLLPLFPSSLSPLSSGTALHHGLASLAGTNGRALTRLPHPARRRCQGRKRKLPRGTAASSPCWTRRFLHTPPPAPAVCGSLATSSHGHGSSVTAFLFGGRPRARAWTPLIRAPIHVATAPTGTRGHATCALAEDAGHSGGSISTYDNHSSAIATTTHANNMADRNVLPDHFRPAHYDLVLKDLDFKNWSYNGSVTYGKVCPAIRRTPSTPPPAP